MLRYVIMVSALTCVGACKSAQQTEEKYELKSPCASASIQGKAMPCAAPYAKDGPLPPKDITELFAMADIA